MAEFVDSYDLDREHGVRRGRNAMFPLYYKSQSSKVIFIDSMLKYKQHAKLDEGLRQHEVLSFEQGAA
jgi:hypothetical protein